MVRGQLAYRQPRKTGPPLRTAEPVDEIGVSICVAEGVPIALTHEDRFEAMRRMCARGIPWIEQGRRLKISPSTAENWANRRGLKLLFIDERWFHDQWASRKR